MRRVTIVHHGGGELANQLWNFASIFAYCKARGYALRNYSFFEYQKYFNFPKERPLVEFLLFLPFKNSRTRKSAWAKKIWRKAYGAYAKIIAHQHRNNIIYARYNTPYYLPPTHEPTVELARLEATNSDIYFHGWTFRNPRGLELYRDDVKKFFLPRTDICARVEGRITAFRAKRKKLIGIHIRQGDYATWKQGAYFVPQQRVREIIDEYCVATHTDPQSVHFAITSDGPVDRALFDGLSTFVSHDNMVADLYLLSKTDLIIGANSSFGDFAAYLGNIPHVVTSNEPIDWEYYNDKTTFFENKYCTMVHY